MTSRETAESHGLNARKDIMDKMLQLFPMMEQAKQARQNDIEPPPLVDRLIFMETVSPADRTKFIEAAQRAGDVKQTLE